MTKFLIGAAAIAMTAATPGSAQILGGGIGGGLGGGIGSLGGSIGGSLGGTVENTQSVTTTARQAERAARRAERHRDRQAENAGEVAVSGGAGAQAMLDAPNMRTRGVVAATARGMRRVAQTSTGVPVFVSAQAISAPAIIVPPILAPYPVFERNVYYGGTDVVFIPSAEVGGYMDRQYDDLHSAMAGTGATVIRRGHDLVVELPADVTFAFDKSDIQPRFYGTLNALARSLDTYRATDVEIVGHTDAIGSETYNLSLSERRGRSVADFLVNRSAEPARLVVEAMGESEPVASNATISGRAANRRVEIILHSRMG